MHIYICIFVYYVCVCWIYESICMCNVTPKKMNTKDLTFVFLGCYAILVVSIHTQNMNVGGDFCFAKQDDK